MATDHYSSSNRSGFTLVELLVVMAIIAVLAGLVLGTAGFMQKKAAKDRARAEIKAMELALESYKADNGVYPRNATTDGLDAKSTPTTSYAPSSKFLYAQLSGDFDYNSTTPATGKAYMEFKPNMLSGTKDAKGNFTTVNYLLDPFGNSYGYSTANQADPNKGYNPTFDLWSTGGKTGAPTDTASWVTNW